MLSRSEAATPVNTGTDAGTVAVPRAAGKSAVREAIEALAIAVLVAICVRSFVVQAFKIPSGSMVPTLQVGDHILVNKFVYGLRLPAIGTSLFAGHAPRRGDVVVFTYPVDPTKDFIKRVVGVAGDVVQIRDKRVYVNAVPWDETYAYFADGNGVRPRGTRDNFGPVTVPAGQVFVMGDNRDRSYDSRFWGFVDANDIKGQAFVIYWSWDDREHWVRWDRLGQSIE